MPTSPSRTTLRQASPEVTQCPSEPVVGSGPRGSGAIGIPQTSPSAFPSDPTRPSISQDPQQLTSLRFGVAASLTSSHLEVASRPVSLPPVTPSPSTTTNCISQTRYNTEFSRLWERFLSLWERFLSLWERFLSLCERF